MHCLALNKSSSNHYAGNRQIPTHSCGSVAHLFGSVCLFMLFLPEMCLEGKEITITLPPIGVWSLYLVIDKVLLIVSWDNVLIETVGAWLSPLSPLGGQQIPCGLLSFPVWRFSLGVEYGLPVGQAGCPRELMLRKGPPTSFFTHPWNNSTLSPHHLLEMPHGTEYKLSTTITYSVTHSFS